AHDRERGVGKAAFLTAATGLMRHTRAEELTCRVCPQRPVAHTELRLCQRHLSRWQHHERTTGEAEDLAAWLSQQLPLPGYGPVGWRSVPTWPNHRLACARGTAAVIN